MLSTTTTAGIVSCTVADGFEAQQLSKKRRPDTPSDCPIAAVGGHALSNTNAIPRTKTPYSRTRCAESNFSRARAALLKIIITHSSTGQAIADNVLLQITQR